MKIKRSYGLIILILIFGAAFLLMVFSSFRDSQTTDEAIHQYAGWTYLTKRDFRLDPEHPPLLKELSAVPLFFYSKLQTPRGDWWNKAQDFYYDSWFEARKLGENFYYASGNDPAKLLFYGRLPFMILTLLLGFAVFWWAKRLYGEKAGILAAFLILFLPTVLAHGRLINTDLGLTLFFFLTVYLWGKFLKSPNWLNFLLAGGALGLTLAAKFTGLIILPILLVLAIICLVQTKEYVKVILGYLGILGVAFLIVWLSYGFSSRFLPLPLPSYLNRWDAVRFLLFPAEYFKGLYLMYYHAISGHGSFLLGQASNSGWWYYFPVAIFYKTPLPFFLFLLLALVFWRRLRAKELFDEVLLLLPPIAFLAVAMFSHADLGVRHILPIFPFLAVYVARSINLINWQPKILNVTYIFLILWYLTGTLVSFPNFLAYFNEAAGGAAKGYKVLADSNLDWGQDMYRLRDYLRAHNLQKIYLVYPWNGDEALRYYGIDSTPLYPENKNIHGPVAISVTYLHMDAYSWLKDYPFEQITPGLFLFNLP